MITIRTRPPERQHQPPAPIYDERLTEAVRRMRQSPCCDGVAWPVNRGVAVIGRSEVGGDITSVCMRCARRRLVDQLGVIGWRTRDARRGQRLVNPVARRAALDEGLSFMTLGIRDIDYEIFSVAMPARSPQVRYCRPVLAEADHG